MASSTLLKLSIKCIAASFAPPCKGPIKAPIAAATALKISLFIEAQILAVKVEALNSCYA